MRVAQPLGLTPDGRDLLVVTTDGEHIAIPADGRLRAAIRGDLPRLGQLEIAMDSALTPREIQARIRAGETLDEVARVAGVPSDRIAAFADPVIAERRHMAEVAQACQVRRTGEPTAQRTLGEAVAERLISRSIDPDSAQWDAWRSEGRTWVVSASYHSGSAPHRAEFSFDHRARFSTASNDDARWLIGDVGPSHGPQPGRRRPGQDPDSEPTIDLNDELALVRAVQNDPLQGSAAARANSVEIGLDEAVDDPSDYAELELEQVDGIYDIVPGRTAKMDVLYEMLASFNEDSVNIYHGLTDPIVNESPSAREDSAPVDQLPEDDAAPGEIEPMSDLEPESAPNRQVTAFPLEQPPIPPEPEQEQESLMDITVEEVENTVHVKSPKKKKRASVPSWDEIMFGGPRQPKA